MQKTQRKITPALLCHYTERLREQERSAATVEKYTRALHTFYLWLPEGKTVDRETAMAYKQFLSGNHSPGGVNVELAALNGFFRFMGWDGLCLKRLRIQRRAFADRSRELTREEYERLVAAAGDGDTEQADGHVARATVENTIKYYTTLKAAVDAADSGSIVSLLADVTIAAEANKIVVTNKAVTIEGDSARKVTITGVEDAFTADSGGTLTLGQKSHHRE